MQKERDDLRDPKSEQALDAEQQDAALQARYERLLKAMDERFDIRGSDLSILVVSCLDDNGRVSSKRRRQFGDRVPADAFDVLEKLAAGILQEESREARHLLRSKPDDGAAP